MPNKIHEKKKVNLGKQKNVSLPTTRNSNRQWKFPTLLTQTCAEIHVLLLTLYFYFASANLNSLIVDLVFFLLFARMLATLV